MREGMGGEKEWEVYMWRREEMRDGEGKGIHGRVNRAILGASHYYCAPIKITLCARLDLIVRFLKPKSIYWKRQQPT